MTRFLATTLALAIAVTAWLPRRVSAAPAVDDGSEPPTGRGLIIAGGVVGGVGIATMIPGIVFLALGRSSREGLGSFLGGVLLGVGSIALVTGTGLLVPGLVRRHRHREYVDAMRARASGPRLWPAPGGFVVRF